MDTRNDTVISVCLCTYKRPGDLSQCLHSILIQSFTHSFEVIVADNDTNRSGEYVVTQFKEAFKQAGIPLKYLVESTQNIALARNRSLQSATGEYVAFIDDDEHASSSWLNNLFLVMTETEADGVWGPVTPEIPESFPKWMHRSNLFQRENPKDRSVMKGHSLRTGNALIKQELLCLRDGPFDGHLGKIGGSDYDLFNWIRMKEVDIKFVWASNAEVVENIEKKRRHIKWHLRRAYRGGWGVSRGLALRYGIGKGFIFSTIRIIPSFIKALKNAIVNYNNIRYAGLIILINIVLNLGKCGYFLGIKIEEYQG